MNALTPIAKGVQIAPASAPEDARREYLLQALRAGSLRAKLAAAEIDEIGIALKSHMISPEDALDWITSEFGVDRWCFPEKS